MTEAMIDAVSEDAVAATVSLDQLAPLRLAVRYENRFVLDNRDFPRLLRALEESHRVLEVGGTRVGKVETLYLDTPSFDLYRAHFRSPRRWKLRIRTYKSNALSRAELKMRDGRGRTRKAYGDLRPAVSIAEAKDLALASLADDAGSTVQLLRPAIRIEYRRVTFVDVERQERLTVDECLRFHDAHEAKVAGISDGWMILETKSERPRATVARLLRRCGARPLVSTKYTAGIATAGYRRPVPGSVSDLRRYFEGMPPTEPAALRARRASP